MPDDARKQDAVSTNPFNGRELARHRYVAPDAIDSLIATSARGFDEWSAFAFDRRAAALRSMARLLERDVESLAMLATCEMGKPIRDTRAEVRKCAALCDWYADHAAALLADEPANVGSGSAYVAWRPLGVVFAVMPWNFPYWQAMRAGVPIVTAGNAFLFKPASNVVGSALALARLWLEAGLPTGTFAVLNASHDDALSAIDDDRIVGATVTGSTSAGAAVAARAGAALKKSLLELGGADPFIVLADADLDAAVAAAVTSRFQNAGQVCIAAKRFIIEAPIADAFIDRFSVAVEALKIGDPMDEATQIGPMARVDLRDELHDQVTRSIAAGARAIVGGDPIDRPGSFYAPTILVDVAPGMPAFDEELFGPVAAVSTARDADHAVELANQSRYGLSGALWSADIARASDIAARLQTGSVFINGFSVSDPNVPIGGIRNSGHGRELSYFGLREFVNAQTVWIGRR